jgi:multimeric flavodoxin WrbA
MKAPASALLLVGSPKKGMSTSEVLGTYILGRLGDHGVPGRVVRLHRALRLAEGIRARSGQAPGGRDELPALVDAADLVILATPLYVDSLPSHVVAAFEQIAARRARRPATWAPGGQRGSTGSPRPELVARFASVVNCGLPEAQHSETATRICRAFARETGFAWAGGLAMGAGETIGGRPLAKMRRTVRYVVAALDLAGDALAAGNSIPHEAVNLMAKPLVAPALFAIIGDIGWRLQARKFGAQWRLHAQPYEDGSRLKG